MNAIPSSGVIVPPPVLKKVINRTGFPHLAFDKMAPGGSFADVVVVCGTFILSEGVLQAAPVHRGPVLGDRVRDGDAPMLSELAVATDAVLCKPDVDVFVTGTACTADGSPRKRWLATLRVLGADGSGVEKTLRLSGPRAWNWSLLRGWHLEEPKPTASVKLRWQHAYGGYYLKQRRDGKTQPVVYPQNPAGSGFFGSDRNRSAALPGPQLEYPERPIRAAEYRYRPAGFAPIARFWQPRLKLAGTFDAAWRAQHAEHAIADYPADFDLRFFQYAPADQVIVSDLRGGATLELTGFLRGGERLRARLPQTEFVADCDPIGERLMKLDTIHVDLDGQQVHLTWRLTLPHDAEVDRVKIKRYSESN